MSANLGRQATVAERVAACRFLELQLETLRRETAAGNLPTLQACPEVVAADRVADVATMVLTQLTCQVISQRVRPAGAAIVSVTTDAKRSVTFAYLRERLGPAAKDVWDGAPLKPSTYVSVRFGGAP